MIILMMHWKSEQWTPAENEIFARAKLDFFKASSFFLQRSFGWNWSYSISQPFLGKKEKDRLSSCYQKSFQSSIYIKIDQPSVKKKKSRFTQPFFKKSRKSLRNSDLSEVKKNEIFLPFEQVWSIPSSEGCTFFEFSR